MNQRWIRALVKKNVNRSEEDLCLPPFFSSIPVMPLTAGVHRACVREREGKIGAYKSFTSYKALLIETAQPAQTDGQT